MPSNIAASIELSSLRRALRLTRTKRDLSSNPLCQLACIQARADALKITRETALRQILLECVERTRPVNTTEMSDDEAAQAFAVLNLHYLQGRSHLEVAHALHISKAVLYRRAELAINELAALISTEEQNARESTLVSGVSALKTSGQFAPPRNTNACFLGREDVLAQTFDWLENGRGRALALHGPSGIGKSALAIEIASAERVHQLFPGGVALFEVGPSGNNLREFLEQCALIAGIDRPVIEQTLQLGELTRLTREALKTARILFVLDDICTFEDFTALDVCGPYSACIITTRMPSLAQQIAGKNIIKIDALSDQASVDVLSYYAPDAIKSDPVRVGQIVERLGGLPVALVLAGHHLFQASERLNQRLLDKSFAELLSTSADGAENGAASARAQSSPLGRVFETCAARLSPSAQKLLTDLGAFAQKPASISEAALLAVTAASTDDIDELVEASFLEPSPEDRYTIHQSFYEFAVDRLGLAHNRNDLLGRFVRWAAGFTEERQYDYIALEKDFALIQRALNIAREIHLPAEFVEISLNFSPYLRSRGMGPAAEGLLQEAYQADASENDGCARARIANELCQIAFRSGDIQTARRWATTVINLGEQACSGSYLPSALEVLTTLALKEGAMDTAAEHAKHLVSLSKHARHGGIFDRQLAFDSLTPAQVAEIAGLSPARGKIIGYWQKTLIAFMRDGDMPTALNAVEQALKLAQLGDDPLYVVHTLGYKALGTYTIGKYRESVQCAKAVQNLFSFGYRSTMLPTRGYALSATYGGISQTLFGDYQGAIATLEKSLEFGQRTDSHEHLAWTYFGIATSHHFMKDRKNAYVAAQLALAFAQRADSRDTIVSLLRACGYTAIALDRVDEGMSYLSEARRIAIEVWTPIYTDIELAIGHIRKGNLDSAESLLRNASTILAQRGAKQFQIKADFELAKLLFATGRAHEGRSFGMQSLSLCRGIGDMREKEIAAWLASL